MSEATDLKVTLTASLGSVLPGRRFWHVGEPPVADPTPDEWIDHGIIVAMDLLAAYNEQRDGPGGLAVGTIRVHVEDIRTTFAALRREFLQAEVRLSEAPDHSGDGLARRRLVKRGDPLTEHGGNAVRKTRHAETPTGVVHDGPANVGALSSVHGRSVRP